MAGLSYLESLAEHTDTQLSRHQQEGVIAAVDQGEVEDGVSAAVNNHLAVASSQVGPAAVQRSPAECGR
jgi:hypothetical protein